MQRGVRPATNRLSHDSLCTLCRAIQGAPFIISLNTAVVTESAGRCRPSVQCSFRPRGHDKGNILCSVCTDWQDCMMVLVTYVTLALSLSVGCTQLCSVIRIGKQTTCIKRGGICG